MFNQQKRFTFDRTAMAFVIWQAMERSRHYRKAGVVGRTADLLGTVGKPSESV